MAGDCDDGAAVTLAWSEAMVKEIDMGATVCLDPNGTGGGLNESPLQILIDVAAGASVPDASAAGDDARDEPGVA